MKLVKNILKFLVCLNFILFTYACSNNGYVKKYHIYNPVSTEQEVIWYEGVKIIEKEINGIRCKLSRYREDIRLYSFLIEFENNTDENILLNPYNMTISTEGSAQLINPVDPERHYSDISIKTEQEYEQSKQSDAACVIVGVIAAIAAIFVISNNKDSCSDSNSDKENNSDNDNNSSFCSSSDDNDSDEEELIEIRQEVGEIKSELKIIRKMKETELEESYRKGRFQKSLKITTLKPGEKLKALLHYPVLYSHKPVENGNLNIITGDTEFNFNLKYNSREIYIKE